MKKPTTGFTLIELLVVISVIAILLAIAMPSLMAAKQLAQQAVCQSNLRQLGLLMASYASDNNQRFFAGYYEYTDDEGKEYNSTMKDLWVYAIEDYNDIPDTGLCPTATKYREQSSYTIWGDLESRPFYGSYGLNAWICDTPKPVIETEGHLTAYSWRTINASSASNIPMLLDALWVCGRPEPDDSPPETEGMKWGENGGKFVNHIRRFCVNRHRGKLNTVFLDLSLRAIPVKGLWRLKWHKKFDITAPLPNPAWTDMENWPQWMEKLPEPA